MLYKQTRKQLQQMHAFSYDHNEKGVITSCDRAISNIVNINKPEPSCVETGLIIYYCISSSILKSKKVRILVIGRLLL